MKRAGDGTRIIRASDGAIWGAFLAGAGCAEHETDIRGLLRRFGIDPDGRMIAGRSMTEPRTLARATGQVTQTYHLDVEKPTKRTDKVTYLALDEYPLEGRNRQYAVQRYSPETELTGSWDEREFKLAAWSDDAKALLDLLSNAAEEADIAIWTGNTPDLVNNPFSHAGLIIAIVSRMPEEARAAVDQSDMETARLEEAVEATGIRERIEARRKDLSSWSGGPAFHALAPRWTTGIRTVKRGEEEVVLETRHPVVFFLNPARQKDHNHGWFTVEELDLWLGGKGPVIRKAA